MFAILALAAPPAGAGRHLVQQTRKATADVVRVGDQWVVSVEFVPTAAFGKPRSRVDNQRLARDYALRGLARELGTERGRTISVSRMQVEYSGPDNGLWKARFTIPVDGVAECPAPPPAPAETTDDDAADSRSVEVCDAAEEASQEAEAAATADTAPVTTPPPQQPAPPSVSLSTLELPSTPQLHSGADALKPLDLPPLPQLTEPEIAPPSERTP